jgi:hypothetical protein
MLAISRPIMRSGNIGGAHELTKHVNNLNLIDLLYCWGSTPESLGALVTDEDKGLMMVTTDQMLLANSTKLPP